jgi:hypothetical protein
LDSVNDKLPFGAMDPLNAGFWVLDVPTQVEPGEDVQESVMGVPTVPVAELADMDAEIGATPESPTT